MKRIAIGMLMAGLMMLLGACESPGPRDYSTEAPTYFTDTSMPEVRDYTEQILKNHYNGVRRKSEYWVVTEANIEQDPSRLVKEWAEAHIDEREGEVELTIYAYEQTSSSRDDYGELDKVNPMWGAKTRDLTKEKEMAAEVRKRLYKERVTEE